jgi:DnaJ family protein C protein 19
MTRDEAFQVLGLPRNASAQDIREAHRRLMRAAHPDSGGSDWLAARINQARDLLLGGRGRA